MYRCTWCQTPLTEFDLGFHLNLNGTVNKNECTCFRCRTRGKDSNVVCEELKKYQKRKHNAELCWIYVRAIVIAALAFFTIGFWGTWVEETFDVNLYNYTTLLTIPVVIPVFYSAVGAFVLIHSIFYSDIKETGGYEKTYYEITDSYKPNTIDVTQKTEYFSYDNSPFFPLMVIFWITTPIWVWFYWIYAGLVSEKICKRACPDIIFNAFKKTCKETNLVVDHNEIFKRYQRDMEIYNKKLKKVKDKFEVLGADLVKAEIQKIPVINVLVKIEKTMYVFVDYQKLNRPFNKSILGFAIYKNESGEVIGRILLNDSFVYLDNETDWKKEWLEAEISQETLEILDAYKKNLLHWSKKMKAHDPTRPSF